VRRAIAEHIFAELSDRVSVLLSSHLLHEIEALADRLVIISSGRIVAAGAVDDLLAGKGTLVRAHDEPRLQAAISTAGLDARPGQQGGLLVDAEPERVGAVALHGGVILRELRLADRAGLE